MVIINPGDMVEISPACGDQYTATDHMVVARVDRPPALGGTAHLTGQWWPPTLHALTVQITVPNPDALTVVGHVGGDHQ